MSPKTAVFSFVKSCLQMRFYKTLHFGFPQATPSPSFGHHPTVAYITLYID